MYRLARITRTLSGRADSGLKQFERVITNFNARPSVMDQDSGENLPLGVSHRSLDASFQAMTVMVKRHRHWIGTPVVLGSWRMIHFVDARGEALAVKLAWAVVSAAPGRSIPFCHENP